MCRAANESDLAALMEAEEQRLKARRVELFRTLAPGVAERLEAEAARDGRAIRAALAYIKAHNPEGLARLDQIQLKVIAGLADFDAVLSVMIKLLGRGADGAPNLTHSTDDKEQMQ